MEKDTIYFFGKEGQFGFLSNFYSASFVLSGIEFSCSEQAFMYQKAIVFKDYEIAEEILEIENPYEIKKLGRKVKNFNEEIWNQHKVEAMKNIVYAKFSQNSDLKAKLLVTGNKELVEASPYDKIWGIGFGVENPKIKNREFWGENLLGKILMEVREEIRKNSKKKLLTYK